MLTLHVKDVTEQQRWFGKLSMTDSLATSAREIPRLRSE
jgi:hypothetical protein